jgi:hypothetical protein
MHLVEVLHPLFPREQGTGGDEVKTPQMVGLGFESCTFGLLSLRYFSAISALKKRIA